MVWPLGQQVAIRRGVFLSVADLQAAIEAFLKVWNPGSPTLRVDRHRRAQSIQAKLTTLSPNLGADQATEAAPAPNPESGKNELSSYFADTTLVADPGAIAMLDSSARFLSGSGSRRLKRQ